MTRDHGGGIDAAAATHGGRREDWLDLSTGINPVPYPIGTLTPEDWTALPDHAATTALLQAARRCWGIPDGAGIIAAPGASALIARIPGLVPEGEVCIAGPTYNEHAAAFRAAGHSVLTSEAPVQVIVNPNNPDGRSWSADDIRGQRLTVIDESFCDITPENSLVSHAASPGVVVLKSFGKFWGLAGLRLGFAIGPAAEIGRLSEMLGPWAVSGPALRIGTMALGDSAWATATRKRLASDAARLDRLMQSRGAELVGGTSLFRLYDVDDAIRWQERLARGKVWSRIFPYSARWLRLGLPAPDRWHQLEAAL